MKAKELMEKYPAASKVVKEWFLNKLLESSTLTTDVPDDFKEALLKEGVTDKSLENIIDGQPRSLFDVFDKNNLSINIERTPNKIEEWGWNIMESGQDNFGCASRKDAEIKAIEYAFSVLEEVLTPVPIELPKLEE